MSRRCRLVVEEPGTGTEVECSATATIECAACGQPILLSDDAQAEGFVASDLDEVECGCPPPEGRR